MWDYSEPGAGESSEKKVKGCEMLKDFQLGLWVLEVTYHFNTSSANIRSRSILRILGFVILFLCFVGGHLETRDLGLHIWWQWQGCGRLRESNQTWPLSIFFGLSWLSSDIWLGNKPFNSKIFLEFDLQRKCGKSFAKLMRAWDSSWNQKTQDKVMRLGKSGKTWSPLNKRPFHIISSTTPAPNPSVGTIEFYLKKKRGILPIKVPTHLFIQRQGSIIGQRYWWSYPFRKPT